MKNTNRLQALEKRAGVNEPKLWIVVPDNVEPTEPWHCHMSDLESKSKKGDTIIILPEELNG